MRTILWFTYCWLYLLIVEPRRRKVQRLEQQGDRAAHDALVRGTVGIWARRLLQLAGADITVEGLENLPQGPAVYVANHLGYFDIPLLLGYLGDDTKPLVAKKEIRKIPLIRGWMQE
ncbi:MAG: lysophospholipid acyltransferase family protein, partial [Ruthenibacterium sp.]